MMLLIVFGASFMVYNLEAISSDPLAELQQSTAPNKQYLIDRMTRELQLDVPPPVRYFLWLRGIIAGLWGQLNLGMTRDQHPVAEYIGAAIPTTFRLVIGSTVLAIVLGITIGMVTALRQYSRFDYSMTFVSFLLFSIGIIGVLIRRNALVILMCAELMLNAVNLSFVAFAKLHNVTVSDIREWNNGLRSIRAGQKIKLVVDPDQI